MMSRLFEDVRKGADLSPDGVYRYSLSRSWDFRGGNLNIIMLNPSTADHEVDDPTITRCVERAKRLGFGGLVVTNLFAFRATYPVDLASARDPVISGAGR
jgi:hypothetical protein